MVSYRIHLDFLDIFLASEIQIHIIIPYFLIIPYI
jgi:hypothetical protein